MLTFETERALVGKAADRLASGTSAAAARSQDGAHAGVGSGGAQPTTAEARG